MYLLLALNAKGGLRCIKLRGLIVQCTRLLRGKKRLAYLNPKVNYFAANFTAPVRETNAMNMHRLH